MTTLDDTLDAVWQLLGRGAADPRHGYHWPVVCTWSGDDAQGRVVVLRGVDRASRRLWFHTDRRSAKVDQLDGLSWVFYDARAKRQLRLSGSTGLASDEVADAEWARLPDRSRQTYRVSPAPGTRIGGPHEVDTLDDGRPHFTVVVTQAVQLETLRIGREGHERARFTWEGRWSGDWLAP